MESFGGNVSIFCKFYTMNQLVFFFFRFFHATGIHYFFPCVFVYCLFNCVFAWSISNSLPPFCKTLLILRLCEKSRVSSQLFCLFFFVIIFRKNCHFKKFLWQTFWCGSFDTTKISKKIPKNFNRIVWEFQKIELPTVPTAKQSQSGIFYALY